MRGGVGGGAAGAAVTPPPLPPQVSLQASSIILLTSSGPAIFGALNAAAAALPPALAPAARSAVGLAEAALLKSQTSFCTGRAPPLPAADCAACCAEHFSRAADRADACSRDCYAAGPGEAQAESLLATAWGYFILRECAGGLRAVDGVTSAPHPLPQS